MVLPPGTSTDTRRELIVQAIRATGLPPRAAAMSVGVSSSAFYRLVQDPLFVDRLDEATSVFARRMAAVIARAAGGLGSWRAAAFWLERRMGDSYGPRVEVSVEAHADDMDVVTIEEIDSKLRDLRRAAIGSLSDVDLDALVAERRRQDST